MTTSIITVAGTGPGAAAALLRLAQHGYQRVALSPGPGPGYDDALPHLLSARGEAVLRSLGAWPLVQSRAYPLTHARVLGAKDRAVPLPLHGGRIHVVPARHIEAVLLRAAQKAGIAEADGASDLQIVDEPPRIELPGPVAVEARYVGGPWEANTLDLFVGPSQGQVGWFVPEGDGTILVGLKTHAVSLEAAHRDFADLVTGRLRSRLEGAGRIADPTVRALPHPVTIHPTAMWLRPVDPEPRLMTDCGIDLTLATGVLAGDHAASVASRGVTIADATEAYGRKARWMALPTDGLRWATDKILRTHLAGAALRVASLPLIRKLVTSDAQIG